MSLFDIKSISGEQCEDLSRGIVQCFIGTIGSNEEYPITIAADAKALNEKSSLVADISSITKDTDPSNNHADLQFVTGEIARPDVIDSKVVSNDVTGTNDTQVEPVVSGSDSQNSTDAQKETDNSSNSTQSVGQEQNNQPVSGQQSQGPEDQGSEGQNSEETKQDDTSTGQQNQTQSSNQTSTEQTP